MNEFFGKVARGASTAVGSPVAFVIALSSVVLWALSGPVFGYSERWQLVINTGTTIVTFLMVFIIQNAENRNQKAVQLKLDELLRAIASAKTGFVDLEHLDDDTLSRLESRFKEMHQRNKEDVYAEKRPEDPQPAR